jgi:exonuclease III
VRNVILSSKADIVCLQETKAAAMSSQLFYSVFVSSYDKYVTLPAIGNRGVLVAWKSSSCQAISSHVDSFSVKVQFTGIEGRNWWFTEVYGPQEDEEKLLYLHEGLYVMVRG